MRGTFARRGMAALAGAAGAAALACGLLLPDGSGREVPGWQPVNPAVSQTLTELGAGASPAGGAAAGPVAAQVAPAGSQPAGVSAPGGPSAAPASVSDGATAQTAAGATDGGASAVPNASSVATAGEAPPAAVGAAPPAPAAEPGRSASGLLNINTATVDQLDGLPGIGPSKARAIVAYREAHGSFRSADDLRQVKGIGPKLMAGLRDLVATE
ncbi:ComEA family DNA-binding protein [Cohnella sp. REN36]|uniref:ComEA family DNA-binding protein n=1 Tax=Cohnella sp. REN36 TaxID=2887347 RepID=UPI001D1424DB|nr:ComEA family DNA-binding protein [Cohnella sp. REN36]MCC3375653.1 ComEA family DNA-binding protein [Cohnella sp. REN36]